MSERSARTRMGGKGRQLEGGAGGVGMERGGEGGGEGREEKRRERKGSEKEDSPVPHMQWCP